MRVQLTRHRAWSDFVSRVEEISGQAVLSCYQCGKCAAGCPAVDHMDLLPSQVLRYLQLGLENELRQARTPWICATCLVCNARCPKGIGIAEVMEALRLLQLRENRDRLVISQLAGSDLEAVPTIALVSSLRKYTA